jgi:hypothetical protein
LLAYNSKGNRDEERLQPIILKLFEGETYKKGRITTNIAQVIYILSSSSIYLSNYLGTSAIKWNRLWLFLDLLYEKVFC